MRRVISFWPACAPASRAGTSRRVGRRRKSGALGHRPGRIVTTQNSIRTVDGPRDRNPSTQRYNPHKNVGIEYQHSLVFQYPVKCFPIGDVYPETPASPRWQRRQHWCGTGGRRFCEDVPDAGFHQGRHCSSTLSGGFLEAPHHCLVDVERGLHMVNHTGSMVYLQRGNWADQIKKGAPTLAVKKRSAQIRRLSDPPAPVRPGARSRR